MTKLAFIDIETTGLDPTRHEIWSIGLVVDHEGVTEEYQWYLPVTLATAEPMALKVGKFYDRHPSFNKDLKEKVSLPRPTARQLAVLTDGAHLVGNVVSFDAGFLNLWMRSHGAAPTWHYHLVDCEALAAGKLGHEPPWKSQELSERLGVEVPGEEDRHSALADAHWARRIYYAALHS
jgi:DNA polymerase III alpha subunit (gram-positive type)